MPDKSPLDKTPAEPGSLTLKQKAGDAANRWLERNRNLVLRQTPVWAQSITGLMLSLGVIAITGSIVFKIDEVVTVTGQLESIGGTVEVKTPAGGRVAEVLFKDGEHVDKGQLLVVFDTRQASEQKATLANLISLEQRALKSRLLTIDSQIQSLESRSLVLEKKLSTNISIANELKNLVAQGGFQKLQYLQKLDEVYELQKSISQTNEEITQKTLLTNQTRLSTMKSIDEMKNKLKSAELQLQYQTVLAPVNGIVFDPQAGVEGVLQAGERILSLVPQNGLFAKVFVPNQDIGFVKTGQEAKVRIDAFPFTRYGELKGEVTHIGADALPPDESYKYYRFPVKLNLNRDYLNTQGIQIPLKSGMSITTNLKLREKRVISLLSDLLVDQTDSIKSIRQQ